MPQTALQWRVEPPRPGASPQRRPASGTGRVPLLVEATRSTSESLLRPLALVLPLTEILYLFNAQVGELGIVQQRLLA